MTGPTLVKITRMTALVMGLMWGCALAFHVGDVHGLPVVVLTGLMGYPVGQAARTVWEESDEESEESDEWGAW